MTPPKQYPLCEALGAKVQTVPQFISTRTEEPLEFVHAYELERILAAAPEAWGQEMNGKMVFTSTHVPGDTHVAKTVCVQPIVRDSAESLLREFVSAECPGATAGKLRDRARTLLGGKGEG